MSTTIDPVQPAGKGEYPLSALVPSFIRQFTNQAGYAKATGKNPPAYNPEIPIKTWDDPRKFTSATLTINYTTIVLDDSAQHAVVRTESMPAFVANSVNIPPDSGPTPGNVAGAYVVPVRPLLPNERPLLREGGLIDIVNTDIDDPDPIATIKALVQRLVTKAGA